MLQAECLWQERTRFLQFEAGRENYPNTHSLMQLGLLLQLLGSTATRSPTSGGNILARLHACAAAKLNCNYINELICGSVFRVLHSKLERDYNR